MEEVITNNILDAKNTIEPGSKLPSLRKVGKVHGYDIYVDFKGLTQAENADAFIRVIKTLDKYFNAEEVMLSFWQKLKALWK